MINKNTFIALLTAATAMLPHLLGNTNDGSSIERLFSIIDNPASTSEEKAHTFSEGAVILSPGKPPIVGRDAIRKFFADGENGGHSVMKHQIVHVDSYPEIAILRGFAIGYYTPEGSDEKHTWKNNFLMVLERTKEGGLLIQQDAYNMLPAPSLDEVLMIIGTN